MTAPPPGLRRRLACLLYEGVLLFGVVTVAGLLWSVATQRGQALQGHTALQVFMFLVLGAYFVYCWTRSGQTLAMQTWKIRVVAADGRPPGVLRAAARYLLAWLWFVPALATAHFSGLEGAGPIFAAVLAGMLTYALLARLHPERQFLHDLACGTRLVRCEQAAS